MSDSDASVTNVQFFADTNLIGSVTEEPFNVVWSVTPTNDIGAGFGTVALKAAAFDDLGRNSESAPVQIGYSITRAPLPLLRITSPSNGTLFAAPATFAVTAELVASQGAGDNGPVEFLVGTNSVGIVTQAGPFTATSPPFTAVVTNLPEGTYTLSVNYRAVRGAGFCQPITIRVTKLGLQSPRLTPDGRFAFAVVTSFPGKQTVIQASPNLLDWSPISTNVPSSNAFTFTEPSPATNAPRFYRVLVPPQ